MPPFMSRLAVATSAAIPSAEERRSRAGNLDGRGDDGVAAIQAAQPDNLLHSLGGETERRGLSWFFSSRREEEPFRRHPLRWAIPAPAPGRPAAARTILEGGERGGGTVAERGKRDPRPARAAFCTSGFVKWS